MPPMGLLQVMPISILILKKKKIGILSILDHIIYAHIELNVTLLIMLQNAAFRE